MYSLGSGPVDNQAVAGAPSSSSKTIADAGLGGTSAGGTDGVGSTNTSGAAAIGGTSTGGHSGAGGLNAGGNAAASSSDIGGDAAAGSSSGGDAGCSLLKLDARARVISLSPDKMLGNDASFQPTVSADGRTVVFASSASNLVPGDTNRANDVFAYDVTASKLIRISVDSTGGQFADPSLMPTMSADGSRVAFTLAVSNFGGSGTDSVIALTEPSFDANQFVPGLSAASPLSANSECDYPMLTNNASLLVYESRADNIVPGDTNTRIDFFAYKPGTGTTQRLITGNDDPTFTIDTWAPSLAANGSVLAFSGHFGNMPTNAAQMNVALLNLGTSKMEWAGTTPSGSLSSKACYAPALSAAGDAVAFLCDADDIVPGDTNGCSDAFVRDVKTGTNKRISLRPDGSQWDAPVTDVAISGDGRWVVYQLGYPSTAATPNPYGGLYFYDRHCDHYANVSIDASEYPDIGDIGTVSPFLQFSLSQNGSVLAGIVSVAPSSTASSQVVVLSLAWPSN